LCADTLTGGARLRMLRRPAADVACRHRLVLSRRQNLRAELSRVDCSRAAPSDTHVKTHKNNINKMALNTLLSTTAL